MSYYLWQVVLRSTTKYPPPSNAESGNTRSELTDDELTASRVKLKGSYKITAEEATDKVRQLVKDQQLNIKAIRTSFVRKDEKTGKDMYWGLTVLVDSVERLSLVSADERIPEVFCLLEGNSLQDTIDNIGLRDYIRLLDNYVVAKTARMLNIDSLCNTKAKKVAEKNNHIESRQENPPAIVFDPDTWTYIGTETTTTVVKAVGQDIPFRFHQNAPYNETLPLLSNGEHAACGCCMVATAGVMSYHRRPFHTITKSVWDSMITYPSSYKDQERQLMEYLFYELISDYDTTGTSSTTSKIINFLNNNYYDASTSIQYGYNFNVVCDALQYGPTIIGGYRLNNGAYIGHNWILNKAKSVRTVIKALYTLDYNGTIYEHYELLSDQTTNYNYFCWGRISTSSDGWFSTGNYAYSSDYNYQYNIDIIKYIK